MTTNRHLLAMKLLAYMERATDDERMTAGEWLAAALGEDDIPPPVDTLEIEKMILIGLGVAAFILLSAVVLIIARATALV